MFVSRKAKRVIAFAFLISVLLISVLRFVSDSADDKAVFLVSPVSRFDTDSEIYTVIAIADESTSLKTAAVFAQICRGLGIEPTFFGGTETIKRIKDVVGEIRDFRYEFGIICENTSGMTRSQMLKYLAQKNDDYYSVVGKHSICCYINGTNSRYASDVMASYGQYGISYSVLAGEKGDFIRNGDIAAVKLSSETSVYDLVSLVTEAASKGLKAVPMKEYILEYESLSES